MKNIAGTYADGCRVCAHGASEVVSRGHRSKARRSLGPITVQEIIGLVAVDGSSPKYDLRVRDHAGVEGLWSTLRRQAGPITFGSPENRRPEPVWDNFRVIGHPSTIAARETGYIPHFHFELSPHSSDRRRYQYSCGCERADDAAELPPIWVE